MEFKHYILKEEELNMFVQSIIKYGDDETYNRMLTRSLIAINEIDDADEMLMDMHQAVIKRARNIGENNDNEKSIKSVYYRLASILRILAHRIQREYIRKGHVKNSERFLRVVQ
jgi:hypothetical protein